MSKPQFKADVDILTTADSGWRDPYACLWGIFHTTEDAEGKDPEETARWQLDPANDSSYNVLVGDTGKTVRSNDDDYQPWSVGQPGNRLGFHVSAIGKARRTREQWLSRPKQLESLARWAADLHTRYGLPLRWLTVEEVRAQRVKGFTSHAVYWQALGRVRGMDVRTDPGEGFPHDVVLARAAEIAGGGDTRMSSSSSTDDGRLDLVLDQLAGTPWRDFPGWPQIGGLTIVDALAAIGEKLGIDGFKDTRDASNVN